MFRRWLRNSWFGHKFGLHSPSALAQGRCWCQRNDPPAWPAGTWKKD